MPGLKLVVPGTPDDAYHLLRSAIVDDDPVLYFEHKAMLNLKGDVDTRKDRPYWVRPHWFSKGATPPWSRRN